MNHFRELLDTKPWDILVPEESVHHEFSRIWADINRHAPQTMCFWLGDIDSMGGRQIIPGICRLPYDVCWFEFSCSSEEKVWFVGCLVIKTPSQTRIIEFRRMRRNWELRSVLDMEEFCSGNVKVWPGRDDRVMEAIEVRKVLASFLSALNCTNVERRSHSPDSKLQKARLRKGKAPLFSYWTLELCASGVSDKRGGTHASPRVHLRRGHARQYAPGKWTWVNPCAVGNKLLGVVHKDYSAAGLTG